MRSFLNIIITLVIFSSWTQLKAQDDEDVRFEEIDTILNKVILKKEMMGGAMLHFHGLGLIFRKGYNASAFRKNLWEIEFLGMKSNKEVKITNYFSTNYNAKSYIYGKLNKIYILRAGLGSQKLLNTKPYWGGVEVRLAYYGGFSLGLAKPYYLNIVDSIIPYGPFEVIMYINPKRYDPEKHFNDDIYGRAPWVYGLNEVKFYPGVYVKGGLNFEFGQYNTSIKSLEVGIAADFYPIPIPVVANIPESYYFIAGYLNFTFGKRFNKY